VNIETLKIFCCPSCRHGPLELVEPESVITDGQVDNGLLACPGCAQQYLVRNGVPRFVRDEEYAGSFGFQWNKFRRTQLDSHSGLPHSRNRLFGTTQWQSRLDGQLVLEAGSGAGRFTEVLLETGATLFSFDLSKAVDANRENNAGVSRLHLFQGSIFDIPLRTAVFDKVLCLGVIQHTPDPERAFASLARMLKPGGEIAIDVYARHLRALISWKYLLRPFLRRLDRERLFLLVERAVAVLLPVAVSLRRLGGRYGARLMPILEYSHLKLPPALNREWAILDTFDMYSPAHDHPRSIAEVRRWFETAGLERIVVEFGPNGIVARGRRGESVGSG
jgi:SAM-dependent methyltransferase